MIRLSNSSTNTLKDCGQYYKYHYIDRIRPITIGSALFFGSAIDNALNSLLESKLKISPVNYEHKCPFETFKKSMETVTINETIHQAKTCEFIQYSKADLDMDLLTDDDLEEIKTLPQATNWLCLYRRGMLLIQAYIDNVYPTIDYVVSVQEKVELPNAEGDMLTGVIDAILKFKDDENIYICDNKTSSIPYKESDLYNSKQLATYAEYKGISHVSYLVLEKKIRKNEPKVRTQILKGEIESSIIEKTFLDYQESLCIIKKGDFTRNYKKCYSLFGKACPYLNLCKNKSMDGLKKLENK